MHVLLERRQRECRPIRQVQHGFGQDRPRRKVVVGIDGHARCHEREDPAGRIGASHGRDRVAVGSQHVGAVADEQLHRRLDDRIEHRGHIGGRLADDAQDVGRGRLLCQRLLRLVEQPRVLDRDHRLVSEAGEQLLLLRREAAERRALQIDGADATPALHQRRHHLRVVDPGELGGRLHATWHVGAIQHVGKVEHASRCDGHGRARAGQRHRKRRSPLCFGLGSLPHLRCAHLANRACGRQMEESVVPDQHHAHASCIEQVGTAVEIFSSTGCASDTERLMTCSTSAVAVCRSSASCVSLNSRVFSMAISAWSRNDSASAMALGLKAFAFRLPSTHAHALVAAQQRQIERRVQAQLFMPRLLVRREFHRRPIGYVQHGLAANRTRRKLAAGSTGITCAPGTGARPAGVAMAWGE